jgi:hypothetical protein
MEWCRGINLAFVAHVDEPVCRPQRGMSATYRLMGVAGECLQEVNLDEDEVDYFFPRAIVPAPPGMEMLRLRWDVVGVVRDKSMVVALLLPQEFTEPAIPICAEGQVSFRSTADEMVLWRYPGQEEWREPGDEETYSSIEDAEAAFLERGRPMPT